MPPVFRTQAEHLEALKWQKVLQVYTTGVVASYGPQAHEPNVLVRQQEWYLDHAPTLREYLKKK